MRIAVAATVLLAACSGGNNGTSDPPDEPSRETPRDEATAEADPPPDPAAGAPAPPSADVRGVEASGEPGHYTFSVTLQSPDAGCDRYADWWEVVTPEGELVYRRVLAHSHTDEQPFTRSGGPVALGADDVVIVRGHMNPDGYGGVAMRGSAAAGFTEDLDVGESFAPELAEAAPQPDGCRF